MSLAKRTTTFGVAAIALGLVLAGTPVAREAAAVPPPPQSAYFEVPGTNGYTLYVQGEAGHVLLVASKKRPANFMTFSAAGVPRSVPGGTFSQVTYYAPDASEDPSLSEVDLGTCGGAKACGRVAVTFTPSGKAKVTSRKIDRDNYMCATPAIWTRDLGTFSGTIALRGENGFTTVTATSAGGSIGTYVRPRGCRHVAPDRAPARGHSQGESRSTLLTAKSKLKYFTASRGGGRSMFHASASETLPGSKSVIVTRDALAFGPASLIDPGIWQVAVRPPAPFQGRGLLRHGLDAKGSWSGTLAVAFPGVTTPFAGAGFRASVREAG